MDQKSLCRVIVLGREIYFPSLLFLLRHKTWYNLHLAISSQSYYNRHQILSIFMNMIHVFGVITVDFSSNDMDHVHKYAKDLVSVIITLGTNS